MFKNYFKTAWRNLMKNKTFSLINIAGLSIGIAACLLILQYVSRITFRDLRCDDISSSRAVPKYLLHYEHANRHSKKFFDTLMLLKYIV